MALPVSRTHLSACSRTCGRCAVQVGHLSQKSCKRFTAVPLSTQHGAVSWATVAPKISRSIRALSTPSDDSSRSLMETAALDDLIDKMLAAKSQQELARLVAENIFSIENKFWLRVATRNDTAASQEEKEKLKSMADAVMVLVQTVMRKTEQQLADSSKILQDILSAAADEKGEWYLPLAPEQVASMRAALDRHSEHLDEALLSNAFAWIRKCNEDRFDTMVSLIQKVLQLYAARQLRGPETSGVEGAVNQVVYAEEGEWSGLIRRLAAEGVISEPSFMEALQRRMEATVLGLQSGSYAQRVQAEYLKEVESRARAVFKELAQSKA